MTVRLRLKLLLTTVVILIAADSKSQKQDYYWPFNKDIFGEVFKGVEFDFNNIPFSPSERNSGLAYDQQILSQSDEEGNLLFTCNGCTVANAMSDTMLNGHGMHEGEFVELLWSNNCDNLPGVQELISLQDPGNPDGYYIFHKLIDVDFSLDPILTWQKILATYVDMSGDNGLGEVQYRDSLVAEGDYTWSYFTAIKHNNQNDWWLVQPTQFPDSGWHSYLITENGVEEQPYQDVGPDFKFGQLGSGYAHFSPDGESLAYFNQRDGLHLYDFDRASGLLSNFKHMEFHPLDTFGFSCMEFSPNSRFLYVSDRDSLWQVDSWSDDMGGTKVLLNVNTDPTTDYFVCLLYTSPSPRDATLSRMPSSA